MSIFAQIKSMRVGEAKALRDIAFVKAYEAEHDRRHDQIPGYECGPVGHKFYDELGSDVNKDDIWEFGAYIATSEKYKRQVQDEIDPVTRALEAFPGATVIPFHIEPGEDPSKIQARIQQAFEDSVALAHLDEPFEVSGNEEDDEEKK